MRYLLPQLEHVPLWPVIAGPIFFALFIGICLWVYRRERKPIYREIEKLPLEDEPEQEEHRHEEKHSETVNHG